MKNKLIVSLILFSCINLNAQNLEGFVSKLDSSGKVLWFERFNSVSTTAGLKLFEKSNSQIAVVLFSGTDSVFYGTDLVSSGNQNTDFTMTTLKKTNGKFISSNQISKKDSVSILGSPRHISNTTIRVVSKIERQNNWFNSDLIQFDINNNKSWHKKYSKIRINSIYVDESTGDVFITGTKYIDSTQTSLRSDYMLNLNEVNNNDISNTINLSPNPTKGNISVLFQQEIKDIDALQIFDVTGKKISSSQIQIVNFSDNEIKISLLDVKTGVYYLRGTVNNHLKFSKSFIIN